jgi:hypothetical protein
MLILRPTVQVPVKVFGHGGATYPTDAPKANIGAKKAALVLRHSVLLWISCSDCSHCTCELARFTANSVYVEVVSWYSELGL